MGCVSWSRSADRWVALDLELEAHLPACLRVCAISPAHPTLGGSNSPSAVGTACFGVGTFGFVAAAHLVDVAQCAVPTSYVAACLLSVRNICLRFKAVATYFLSFEVNYDNTDVVCILFLFIV